MSVVSVNTSSDHHFSKEPQQSITLIAHLGVEGDCHLGKNVQHVSRMKIQPPPPNLRQVHLLHSEFFNEVEKQGLTLAPGEIGENITTEGIDLLGLGRDTRLHFVPADGAENFDLADTNHAVVQVTGLRNPCPQIQKFRPGLQELCVVRGEDRSIVERKSGIMAIVEQGGSIKPDYTIFVDKPKDYVKLEVV